MKFEYVKKHSTVVIIVAIIVVVIAALAARAVSQNKTTDSQEAHKPSVKLLSVKDYSQNSHTISANGNVESLQQVDLKAQTGGKISAVNVKVGSKVRSGQVLASVDSGAAAAALTSARGSLAQAQANYNRLLAGASSEDITIAQVALDSAKSNLENTKQQQQTAVTNAYRSLLNSGLSATPGSSNSGGTTATVSGSYTGEAQGQYNVKVYYTGSGSYFQYSGLETGSGRVDTTPQPLGTKGLYIKFSDNNVPASNYWTVNIPDTQSAYYVANNNAYQSALQTQTSSITAAQNAVAAAQAALDARKAQARPADVQAAEAQILSAQGQVQAAQTAYQNTLITSPFDGEVSALSIKYADVVSPGQKVATVVNQGGLQIKVFVSGTDLAFISKSSLVSIGQSKASGTVTNIAPSVDATTRTGEVDIAIANPQASGLTVGQNVAVNILGSSTQAGKNGFILPLQSVKLTPDGKAFVYTLSGENKAQEISVTTGTVDGENVEVTAGLTEDMQIVSNAYDVSAGEAVQAQ